MAEEQKKSKRWLGYLEIVLAIVFAVAAIAMFSQTWGTKLLYIDATLGRICRFYWIPFIVAVVVLVVGIITLKKYSKQTKTQAGVESASVQETAPAQEAPLTQESMQKQATEEDVTKVAEATIKEDK